MIIDRLGNLLMLLEDEMYMKGLVMYASWYRNACKYSLWIIIFIRPIYYTSKYSIVVYE